MATPALVFVTLVPERVPPPASVSMATLTVWMLRVATFSKRSSAATFTAGEIAAPATASAGSTVKSRCVASAGRMVKALLMAPVRPAAVAASV